ncbi:GDP-mannose 4,6-dehydratase [Planctomicrobium sp. SH527]|uniref:GDP-mannose 4,6-dehydratase n=1 Tax=Planctomicrobium sp. SH527 TaxID=3448123 RepID=UPI003F5B6BC3
MTERMVSVTHSRKKVLITGITGQDGSYLAEFLAGQDVEIWGLARRPVERDSWIDHLISKNSEGNSPRVNLVIADLCDSESIRQALSLIRPDEIYHLAAQTQVANSFQNAALTADTTAMGTLRFLEAIVEHCPQTRFYHASSAEVFGDAQESPQRETTPFNPRNPYGVSKVFATQLVRCYRDYYGLFAVNGISYNHESPRRGASFVTRKITQAAARISLNRQDCLTLGNLDAQRDWGFAGDYVKLMWQSLQMEQPKDYVLATGVTHSVREFCTHAFNYVGRPLTWHGSELNEVGKDENGVIRVRVGPQFYRPADPLVLVGDPTRAKQDLQWKSEVSFQQLVEMMSLADLERERRLVTNGNQF